MLGRSVRKMNIANTARRNSRRNGAMLIYELVVMLAVLGFMSMAIDVGRVQSIKSELRSAADAAALAAGASLNRGEDASVAIAAAVATAAANSADSSPVILLATDVSVGHWDQGTTTFTANALPIDAVKICARRVASRGTAIPLWFGAMIGQATCDVTAGAISRANDHVPSMAFVGLNSFVSQGLLLTDSYSVGHQGDVVSNGPIQLNILNVAGLTWIDGDCTPGHGYSVQKPWVGVTKITGSQAPLTENLIATPVDASYYATHNDNASLPSSMLSSDNDFTAILSVDVSAGTYYIRNLTVAAGALFRVNGAAKFYVTGAITVAATITITGGDPSKLQIKVAGNGPITFAANLAITSVIYAPQSNLTIAAGIAYTGSFLARNVNILGTSYLHYSESLTTIKTAAGASLVN